MAKIIAIHNANTNTASGSANGCGVGSGSRLKARKVTVAIASSARITVLADDNAVAETTIGARIRTRKGLRMPPVRYNSTPS